jgi:hypothetical protein
MKAIPKDIRVLIYIALPFLVVGGSLFLASQIVGGWDALEYFIYALIVAAVWAVVTAGYLVWIIIRDRWSTAAGIASCAVLGTVLAVAATWGLLWYREDSLCRADIAFYEDLAAATQQQRQALIAEGGHYIAQPSLCARDGLMTYFGRYAAYPRGKPPPGDDERLAVLEDLLSAGLPPDDSLLLSFTRYADAGAVELIMARRIFLRDGGDERWSAFPSRAARVAAGRTYCGSDVPAARDEKEAADRARFREILVAMVTAVPPDPALLNPPLRRQLDCLGLVKAD